MPRVPGAAEVDWRITGRVYRDKTTGETSAWINVKCVLTEVEGLVLTCAVGSRGTVLTHLPTGKRIASFRTVDDAKRAARALGPLSDWTQDAPTPPEHWTAVVEAAGGTTKTRRGPLDAL